MLGLRDKGLIVFLSVVTFGLVYFTNLTLPLQQTIYDLKMQLRADEANFQTPIVVVAIDDESLQDIGHWPWPRSTLADLLTTLDSHYQVNHIGLNMLLPEATQPAEDLALSRAFNNQSITSAIAFDLEQNSHSGQLPLGLNSTPNWPARTTTARGWVGAYDLLAKSSPLFGHVNTHVDQDGKLRQLPLFIELNSAVYPQFTIAMLYNLLGAKVDPEIWLETLQPIQNLKNIYIPFDFPSTQIPVISAKRIFDETAPKPLLENALVLVGATSTGMGDFVSTPTDNQLASVFLQAYILNAAMTKKWIRVPDHSVVLASLAITFWTLLLLFLVNRVTTSVLLLVIGTTATLVVSWNIYQFIALGLEWNLTVWLTIFLAHTSTVLLVRYRYHSQKNKQIESLFKSYVPDKVLQTLISGHYEGLDRGERRCITVLFVDLVDFTSLAERCEPEVLTEKIRAIFNALTLIILENNGTIDKYMGDSIMAFWGAPLDDDYQAHNAVKAAMEMRQVIKQDFVGIEIGIGINTGDAVVGNVGSNFRHTYSALGDMVNVASRVERQTRVFSKNILLTQTTATACGYQTYWVADIKIKGRVQCEPIYTL